MAMIRPYRRGKVRHLAAIIEARPSRMKSAEEKKLKPEEYHQKHGRCPRGFRFDTETEKCVPTGKGGKKFKSVEEREAHLNELAEKDWGAYRKEVDRLRANGELPDKETATMLAEISGSDDLPDEVKNDKEKLRELLTQQKNQRAHEEKVVGKMVKYLQNFGEENELAVERGEEPTKLNFQKMMRNIEEEIGRELPVKPEDAAKIFEGNQAALLKGLGGAAPEPNSMAYKMRKFFERVTQPLPDLSPVWDKFFGARSSVEGDNMSAKRMRVVLDTVAETLEQRGAKRLARIVDAEAAGLPEADQMPEPPKSKEWDEDWTSQTSDYGEDLGVPPYDKVRPKTKGDEAAD